MHNIKKMLTTLVKIDKNKFLLLIVNYLLLSLLPLVSLKLTEKLGNSISGDGNFKLICYLLIAQASIMILLHIFSWFSIIIENKLELIYKYYFEKSIKSKLSKIKISFFDNSDTYNKINAVLSMTPMFGVSLLKNFLNLIQGLVSIIGMIYLLRNTHWTIIGILTIICIINFGISRIQNKEELTMVNNLSETKRHSEYLSNLLLTREYTQEIRLFQLNKFLINKWSNLFWDSNNPELNLLRKRATLVQSTLILTQILQFFVLLILVLKSWPNINIGIFMMLSQAIVQFQSSSQLIVQSLVGIHQIFSYIPNYYDLMDFKEENNDEKVEFMKFNNSIIVENLSFRYNNSPSNVLDNINFEIRQGEKVAIVGNNGSGKTTLVRCLLGLYDNFEGDILYDGIKVNNYTKNSFRKRVTSISQNFIRYPYSLKENIYYGDINNQEDETRLNNSLTLSGLNPIFNHLPDKLDSILNPTFNKGIDLSGGQWQKIVLARCFYRKADILFFDEPTSAIDPIAENELYHNIMSSFNKETLIILTHRLGVCKLVDKIIVLENGKVVEIGSHDNLIVKNGYYNKLYLAQSEKGYKSKNELVTGR